MRSTKLCMIAAVFASVYLSVWAVAAEENTASEVAGKPEGAQYPFIAQVTGNNVYVRSGNSQADYPCTKLDAPATVTVVDEVYGWAKILPPEGTFSWIYKAYVKVDPSDPTVGVLTGDNVRVWAGADTIESGSSSGLQTKLNTGEVVDLYPDQPESGDYYKIKPPTGAHLWIHADYLTYVSPAHQDKPIVVPPRPDNRQAPETATTVPPSTQPSGQQQRPQFTNIDGQTQTPQVQNGGPVNVQIQQTEETPKPAEQPVPKPSPKDTPLLKECYDLSAKVDEELKKPLSEQNYTDIKKQLEAIKEKADDSKVQTYAQYLSDRIGRYELAQSVTETLQQQDRQLEQARQKIEQAHQDQLNRIPAEVQYLYTGTLKPSHVYTSNTGEKRYMLVDQSGKIQCYLVGANPAINAGLQQMENSTVGIIAVRPIL